MPLDAWDLEVCIHPPHFTSIETDGQIDRIQIEAAKQQYNSEKIDESSSSSDIQKSLRKCYRTIKRGNAGINNRE